MKISEDEATQAQALLVILLDCLRQVNELGLTRDMFIRKVEDLYETRTGRPIGTYSVMAVLALVSK